jgi:hypothetical protein
MTIQTDGVMAMGRAVNDLEISIPKCQDVPIVDGLIDAGKMSGISKHGWSVDLLDPVEHGYMIVVRVGENHPFDPPFAHARSGGRDPCHDGFVPADIDKRIDIGKFVPIAAYKVCV